MASGFGFGQTVSVKPVWADSFAQLEQTPAQPKPEPEKQKKKKPVTKKKPIKKPTKVEKKKVVKRKPRTKDLPWS